MSQRHNILPYEVSRNIDDGKFYVLDTRTEDGQHGVACMKHNSTTDQAVFDTWPGAVQHAKRLLNAEQK